MPGECGDNLENLCKRCGVCCLEKFQIGEEIIFNKKKVCKFLQKINDHEYHCKVYANRNIYAPWCMSSYDAYKRRALSNTCPYVERYGKDGYDGPRPPKDDQEEFVFELARDCDFLIELED